MAEALQPRAAWLPAKDLGAAGWPHSPGLDALDAALDPLVAVLLLGALAWLIEGQVRPAVAVLALLVFLLDFPGRSQLRLPWWRLVLQRFWGWAWKVALLWWVGQATAYLAVFPPALLRPWLCLVPVVQVLAHLALRQAVPRLVRCQGPPARAVIVGLNPQGLTLGDRLRASPGSGVAVLGFFDSRDAERRSGAREHRLLGGLEALPAYVKQHRVHRIYLSLPMTARPRILAVLDGLKDTAASVYFVPDMFITDLIQGRSDELCGVTVISVCDTPFRGRDGLLKRASDLLLASLILVALSPLLVLIALLIKLDSPGPVIFRQRRYGLDGQEIGVYKFRSMRVSEDGAHIAQAQRGDARITRLGAWLRRTSLDELPQFVNVLQGRMSVVGPRPHAVAHNEMYRRLIKGYMVRHKVRPGITGWAQVNGQRGETDTLQKMQVRIDLDLDYLRHWSLWLDLCIVVRTARLVFKDAHAY